MVRIKKAYLPPRRNETAACYALRALSSRRWTNYQAYKNVGVGKQLEVITGTPAAMGRQRLRVSVNNIPRVSGLIFR